jgi:hypothetical protein
MHAPQDVFFHGECSSWTRMQGREAGASVGAPRLLCHGCARCHAFVGLTRQRLPFVAAQAFNALALGSGSEQLDFGGR